MAKKRTPAKNPAENPAPLTMPGTNGGTLRRGGTNPGAGRPRDVVRAAMLTALDERLPRLVELSKCGEPAIEIKALDMLARYGLGTSNELDTRLKDERVLTREEREDRALTLLKGSKTG